MPAPPQNSHERRGAKRVALQVTTELQFAVGGVSPLGSGVEVEVIDACLDGRGLSLWLPLGHPIPLGKPITLLYGEQARIHGIVVSRLGTQSRYRVGVRVNQDCHGTVREMVRTHSLPPASIP